MPKKIKLAECDLLKAMLERQRIGAAALYDMYASNLHAVIIRVVRHQETAEDVLQQVLMRIWDSVDLYKEQKGRLYTWMVTIARNMAITAVRSKAFNKQSRNNEIGEMAGEVDQLHFTCLNIDLFGVRELLQLLRAEQREVLELLYFQGYTHIEAAEHLDIPLGTLKTRWSVGIKTLRHLLAVRPVAA